jgi:hypothetical protein
MTVEEYDCRRVARTKCMTVRRVARTKSMTVEENNSEVYKFINAAVDLFD